MKKIDYIICFLLLIISFISRFPLVEKIQSHWDGPQFSIAIVRFSLQQQTPTTPGYPLYVAMGKFFHLFISGPHQSILAVSVLASMLGSIIFYLIGKNLYSRAAGIIMSAIFLTGSTFYYFALTPYGYELLPPLTALLAYFVYKIFIKHEQIGLIYGLCLGLLFGVRPQEILLFGPLALLGFIYLSKKQKIYALLIFSIITTLWIVPIIYSSGGMKNYIDINFSTASTAFPNRPITQNIETIIKGFLLSFGIAAGFLLYYFYKLFRKGKKYLIKNIKVISLFFIWMAPGIFFNLFIRTDHAGYQMSYLTAFIIIIAYTVWKSTEKSKALFLLAFVAISVFNLYWFFYNRDPNYVLPYRPTSFHYSDIRKNDLKTGSKVNFILSHFSPKQTLVITNSVLWRPYMYYFKDYQVTSLDGLVDNTPSFYHIERNAKNWNMQQFENKDLSLIIPKGINYIVMPDDENYLWIKIIPTKLSSFQETVW